MHVLYADKYDDLAKHLFVLSLLPLFLGLGNTMYLVLIAGEQPKLVFIAFVCSAAATFMAGIPLVMHFGLWGAVYGMLLSALTYTGALAFAFTFRFRRWRRNSGIVFEIHTSDLRGL